MLLAKGLIKLVLLQQRLLENLDSVLETPKPHKVLNWL